MFEIGDRIFVPSRGKESVYTILDKTKDTYHMIRDCGIQDTNIRHSWVHRDFVLVSKLSEILYEE